MRKIEHRISATLELRDRFTTNLRAASSQLYNFSKNADRIKGGLTNITRTMERTAIGGTIMGVGVVAGLKNSLTAFADLEDQVRRNKAIMGASASEEAMLMEQTKALGRSTRFTAQEVAQAQMYQAAAGMDANQVLALTPKLLKLSVASGEDLASTSDIITDNLTAFGLKLNDVDRLMDVMAATANGSNTSIGMLGESFKFVAAVSRDFDSMEEVSTMLGLLANSGIKAGIAGRGLAGIYSRLSKLTPDMREQLEKTGTKLYDQNGKFRGLRTIIMESKVALSKMSEEQRNTWLATIAGTEGLKIWSSIMGTSKEDMQKLENTIKNSNGAIDKFATEMGGTKKNKIAEFRSAVDGVTIAIGEGLAPVATDFMNNWIKKINEATDAGLFDTANLENYFRTAESWAKKAVIFYGLVKTAAFAAAHPFVAGTIAAGAAGYYLGKKGMDTLNIDNRASKYISEGMQPEAAYEQAKFEIEYEKRTANFTPEQRAQEVQKAQDILNNAKKEKEEKEKIKKEEQARKDYIKYYGYRNYKGLKYSDYTPPNPNEIINQNHQEKIEQKNTNNITNNTNSKNVNNQTTNNPQSFNFSTPQISLNFPNMIVNNEEAIKRISREVGEEVQNQTASILFSQWNVQR